MRKKYKILMVNTVTGEMALTKTTYYTKKGAHAYATFIASGDPDIECVVVEWRN